MSMLIVSFSIYVIVVMLIGFYSYNITHNNYDYIVGGRRIGPWVSAFSAQASDMSGWLLLGLPGAVFAYGLGNIWLAFGLIIGTFINWQFIARRLRIHTVEFGNSITLPSYLTKRFYSEDKSLRLISAFFILLFFSLYVASGFVAGAKLFSLIMNIDYFSALMLGALIIISYTAVGGFLAVSISDLLQGIMMVIAITILPIVVLYELNGIDNMLNIIRSSNPDMLSIFTNSQGSNFTIVGIISLLAWGFGYFGQPHILARFMAIRSVKEISKAKTIALVWVLVSLTGAILVGLSGYAYLQVNPYLQNMLDSSEQIFLLLTELLFHPLLAGFFLAAVLAAIMSTADSQLLVVASSITEDVLSCSKKSLKDKHTLYLARGVILLVSVIAVIIALNPDNTVLGLVAQAWAGFGSTFGPAILLALFWQRTSYLGICATILVGGLTIIFWIFMKSYSSHPIFSIYEMIPGVLLAGSSGILFSIFFPNSSEIQKRIDSIFQNQSI